MIKENKGITFIGYNKYFMRSGIKDITKVYGDSIYNRYMIDDYRYNLNYENKI